MWLFSAVTVSFVKISPSVMMEACEDGNEVNEDACTNACELHGVAMESSGKIEPRMPSTLKRVTMVMRTCVTAVIGCVEARCGDGIARVDLEEDEEGFEACDDGNDIAMRMHALPTANSLNVVMALFRLASKNVTMAMMTRGDGCTPECLREAANAYLVFVSSELYSGNLGGFEGADGKCRAWQTLPVFQGNTRHGSGLKVRGRRNASTNRPMRLPTDHWRSGRHQLGGSHRWITRSKYRSR